MNSIGPVGRILAGGKFSFCGEGAWEPADGTEGGALSELSLFLAVSSVGRVAGALAASFLQPPSATSAANKHKYDARVRIKAYPFGGGES